MGLYPHSLSTALPELSMTPMRYGWSLLMATLGSWLSLKTFQRTLDRGHMLIIHYLLISILSISMPAYRPLDSWYPLIFPQRATIRLVEVLSYATVSLTGLRGLIVEQVSWGDVAV